MLKTFMRLSEAIFLILGCSFNIKKAHEEDFLSIEGRNDSGFRKIKIRYDDMLQTFIV